MSTLRLSGLGFFAVLAFACGPDKPAESGGAGATVDGHAVGAGGEHAGSAASASAAGATVSPTGATGGGAASSAGGDDLVRAKAALDRNDFAGARTALEGAAQKNPQNGDVFFLLGRACEGGGDKPAAEKAYKEALRLRPDAEEVSENLSALYTDMGRYDEGAATARQGLTKHSESAALHLNLAVALAGKGDTAADGPSAKEFSEAERLSPNDPMIGLTVAHWLGVAKQPEAALVKLRAARAKAGDKVGVLASIGHEMRLLAAFGDCVPTFDKAILALDASAAHAGAGELRTERALCKLGAKDKDGALADLQAAVAKEPTFAPGHFFLAGRLADLKRWDEVAAEYQKYLDLAPSGPLAKQAEERLKIAKARKH